MTTATSPTAPPLQAAASSGPAERLPLALTFVSWLALLVFTVGAVGTALVGQTVFLGTQTIERYAPWSALDPAPPGPLTNHWLGDTLDSDTPRMLLHQRSLADGELAQWNPYVAGGSVGLSVPDSAPFSPLSLPWYVVAETYAPGMVKVLEITTITVGMSLLLRRFRLPSASWALSALVYASSAFMIAWTNWQQTKVAALVPLLFWAVDVAVVGRRWRDATPLALVTAAMLAGGFPSVTGFAAYAGAAYALARALFLTRDLRQLGRAAATTIGGIAAGALLMAWQLLPFARNAADVVDFSVRQQSPDRHLPVEALATAVVPEIYGGPVTSFWGLKWNPVETFSYIGAVTIALVVVALLVPQPTRERRFLSRFTLGALGVTSLLVYAGGPLLGVLQNLPVFSNNSIGRATVLIGFFAAVAAGTAFGMVLDRGVVPRVDSPGATRSGRRPGGVPSWVPRTARLAVAAAVLTGMVLLVAGAVDTAPAEQAAAVRDAVVRAGLLLLLGLLACAAALYRPAVWTRGGAAVLVPVLTAVPALLVVQVWWPKGPVEYFYPRTSTHEFLAANLGHDRFVSVDWAMLPGTSTAYGLRAANGHGWHTTEWKDLLRTADPDVMTTATYSALKGTAGLGGPALDRMAVRYAVMNPSTLPPGTIEVLRTSDAAVGLSTGDVGTATATTPFRGAVLTLPEAWAVGADGATLAVTARTADGTVVTSTSLAIEQDWPAAQMWIPLAAEEPAGLDVELEVEVTSEEEAPLVLAGDSPDALAIEVMRPLDDGLRLVHADGAVVLERLTALDRVRWAGRERVVEDEAEALRLLGSGDVPDDTVLIDNADDALAPDGSTATVTVRTDTTDVLEATVAADGAGWLVVSDSLQGGPGWQAYLDGQPVPLVEADHGMGAVAVPAGNHDVALKYTAPGLRPGIALSLITAALLAAAFVPRERVRRLARLHRGRAVARAGSGGGHVGHAGESR